MVLTTSGAPPGSPSATSLFLTLSIFILSLARATGSRQLARQRAKVLGGPAVWGASSTAEHHPLCDLEAGSALILARVELGSVVGSHGRAIVRVDKGMDSWFKFWLNHGTSCVTKAAVPNL